MTMLEVESSVHAADDVTFMVDTDAVLDAIGPVDPKIEDALNTALDAYVDDHAYYASEQWYSLLHERDSQEVLRTALASALGIDPEDVSSDYGWCTCNWENILSEDMGGSLWDVADGRRYLTIESGERGFMNAVVGVRSVDCEEPEYVIATATRWVMLGCTECDFIVDTAHEHVRWTELTRLDDDGWPQDGLFCPRCGHSLSAEIWI